MAVPQARVPRARSLTWCGACRARRAATEAPSIRRARCTESSCGKRPELPEKAQIVLEEQSQVVHPVAQHRQSIDAGAEGIAGVTLGVDAARGENVRVHHAAA